MHPDMQTAQDMINAVIEQRNAAQNQVVELVVQVQKLHREMKSRDEKIAELETKFKGEDAKKTNGAADSPGTADFQPPVGTA